MNQQNDPDAFIVVGTIMKPHGVHGEVRIRPLTDLPERFKWLDSVFVGQNNPVKLQLASVRYHKDLVLLKFEGYTSRDAVESLRGQAVQILEEDAIPLEEGEYFLYQLEGLQVITDDDVDLGTLVRVIETGANNVFVVKKDDKEVLLPDIDDVVLEIDFENGRMLVHLLPGLI